jgi:hypothetical protein
MITAPEYFETFNDNTLLWRYMGLSKFLWLISKKALWFSVPSEFRDPWEGYLPKWFWNLDNIKNAIRQAAIESGHHSTEEEIDRWAHGDMYMRNLFARTRDAYFISCWHESEYESAALWDIYSRNTNGVAIASSVGRLKCSLKDSELPVKIRSVKYIDDDKPQINESHISDYVVWKRKCFEFEREIRAIIVDRETMSSLTEAQNGRANPEDACEKKVGMSVHIDIEMLVDRIVISPDAPQWFDDVVQSATEQFGYNMSIVKSEVFERVVGDTPNKYRFRYANK